jgi:DNA-directed RNA polymerase sigma subunit (sigma70/sigma32)
LEDAVSSPSRLKDYLLCVQRLEPLGGGELERAFEDWMRGDERARRLLEERHLGLVIAWVQPYRGFGAGFMDLIEAGNRALLRALRRQAGMTAENLEDQLRTAVEESVESMLMANKS